MAKITYISDNHEIHREAKEINFTISEDLNIYEFKIVCQRLASAMGYHHNSIKKAFGNNENYIKEEQSISKLIEVIKYNHTGSKIEI